MFGLRDWRITFALTPSGPMIVDGNKRAGSANGEFDLPRGVATDAASNVYVADTTNNRIQKFDSSGTFLAKWGSPGSVAGQFDFPQGVATDATGHVYVADTGNDRIQKFAQWSGNN